MRGMIIIFHVHVLEGSGKLSIYFIFLASLIVIFSGFFSFGGEDTTVMVEVDLLVLKAQPPALLSTQAHSCLSLAHPISHTWNPPFDSSDRCNLMTTKRTKQGD